MSWWNPVDWIESLVDVIEILPDKILDGIESGMDEVERQIDEDAT